jgi:hypothetical protein
MTVEKGALRQEWEDYRTRHLPKASPAQLKKYRDAFLAGIAVWQELEAKVGSDEELFQLQVQFVQLVTEDLQQKWLGKAVV